MVTTAADVLAGRYELGPVLGRGGMGDVRSARDLRLGRRVAVKLLAPALAGDETARHRFEDEARAAARIVHPNVVAVYDTGEHDGVPYLVMEALPGRTLADEVAAGPLPALQVVRLGREVLAALDAAHGAGVLHRDVKPGNILLGPDGEAKVGDFGIAKTAEGRDHTATGIVVGTPSYLAPERLAGRPASVRTDLYALGVVLHEALTGVKPITGTTLSVTAAATDGAPPALADARPDADPALVAAVARAMAEDPAERFASAAEMAAALPAVDDTGVPTPTVAALPTAAVTTAGGAPATVGVAPTGSVGQAEVAAASATPAPSGAPRRHRRVLWALAVAVLLAALAAGVLLWDRSTSDGSGPVSRAPGAPALPDDLERRVQVLEEAVQP